jgi:hypothetical protein
VPIPDRDERPTQREVDQIIWPTSSPLDTWWKQIVFHSPQDERGQQKGKDRGHSPVRHRAS